tara:strand:- start:951 stop:1844 length:894 start_codon:yes stop_codon:yes gene_type:complete
MNPNSNKPISDNIEISLIIPVFNEENSIDATISDLKSVLKNVDFSFEIIMVDDGSTDSSLELLKNYSSEITLIKHEQNRGYGASLKSGVLKAKGKNIIITDADGTYPSKTIIEIKQELKGNDMVVGARIGSKVHIPVIRKPAKWFINKLANYLSGIKIPDLNSGLRGIKKDLILKYFHLLPDGFSFTTTITLALSCASYKVKYIPIDYGKRVGKSKIRPIHDTLNFVKLIFRTVLYFNPIKVFLPFSLLLIFTSAGLFLYRIFYQDAFVVSIVVLFISGIQLLALGVIADLIVRRAK